ncbi:MAG: helix-turn-helix transcriptional regulator [Terriglobia bacterium]|jgi:transcriptional regulator with XRE-family HTH domain
MARKFKELLDRMTPERRASIKTGANRLRAEMALDELREARALTQEQLAEVLGVRQSTVSKMERRADMYLSSLRKIIQAMGGDLEVRAIFPSGPVQIKQFRELRRGRAGR